MSEFVAAHTLVICGECGKKLQQERSVWVTDPDFLNGDPERAWHGGPVILCPIPCKKKRDRRIVATKKARGSRRRKVIS